MNTKYEPYYEYIRRMVKEENEKLKDPIEKLLHRLHIHIHKVDDLGMHTTASVMQEAIETIEKLRENQK